MPQGKFKPKAKLPTIMKLKPKSKKSKAFTRRSNAPVQKRKFKFNESEKIKHAISKTVNKNAEDELRALASEGIINLSKAQEVVAKHHKKTESEIKTSNE